MKLRSSTSRPSIEERHRRVSKSPGHRCKRAILGLALSAVASVAVTIVRKRYRNSLSAIPAKLPASIPSDAAITEFRNNAKAFIGLYEPMRLIANGSLTTFADTFDEWALRVSSLADAPALADYWRLNFHDAEKWDVSTAAQKAKDVISLANAAGLTPGPTGNETISRETARKYTSLSGTWPAPSTEMTILQPYWQQNETIIEKGILIAKDKIKEANNV